VLSGVCQENDNRTMSHARRTTTAANKHLWIQSAERVIEQRHVWLPEYRPRHRHALPLPSAQSHASFADLTHDDDDDDARRRQR